MKKIISVSLLFFILFSEYAVAKNNPNILRNKFKIKTEKNKKITAAILAFPLPFGIIGTHRIYLGTRPVVPVSYIATLGGCFGILPLIDFAVILSNKDLMKYEKNRNIFMWNETKDHTP